MRVGHGPKSKMDEIQVSAASKKSKSNQKKSTLSSFTHPINKLKVVLMKPDPSFSHQLDKLLGRI